MGYGGSPNESSLLCQTMNSWWQLDRLHDCSRTMEACVPNEEKAKEVGKIMKQQCSVQHHPFTIAYTSSRNGDNKTETVRQRKNIAKNAKK